MTARDTIAQALREQHWGAVDHVTWDDLADEYKWDWLAAADAVIAAVRAMPRDALTELRPDIATEYQAHLDTAATRGQYLLNRLRAHTTTQEAS